MPGLRSAWKATPWGRIAWLAQIVASGIRELEPRERTHARELLHKLARDRRLDRKDREHLVRMAKKVGSGAARGAGPRMFRRR